MGSALRMARIYHERYPFILEWSNAKGRTALHVAALKGNEELVRVRIMFILLRMSGINMMICAQMLCDLGADLDLPDEEGNTPLH